MIYLWRIPEFYPELLIGEYQRDRSPDRFLFDRGTRVAEDIPAPSFVFNARNARLAVLGRYDILPNSTMVPLVTQRVARVLDEMAGEDIQLIPANVTAGGQLLSGFKLVNVLRLVSSIDHSQSNFVCIPGTKQIAKFNRFRVKPDALGYYHLAREAEYHPFILVSEALKRAFETHNFKGCAFIQPENIKP
ncbi:MAG: DUF1629 domain-containing protein [Verrucomicrobiia bacterium]